MGVSLTDTKTRTLMAACSSKSSLTVALARHGVAAAVSIPAVAGFCTVSSPESCIAGCDTKWFSTQQKEVLNPRPGSDQS